MYLSSISHPPLDTLRHIYLKLSDSDTVSCQISTNIHHFECHHMLQSCMPAQSAGKMGDIKLSQFEPIPSRT
ncbi:hypothetical protein PILCRDRAFT_455390 [Piloderma croceum F 1598]|uniref:Uncharacterized protein n=1 Tax=Piloderma croceum (strain F 1598) TaxID=765440 RepID=A0A0C3FSU1_PILCF|nr:hypothetical protein PILCRDRAFT_455390 [Piloderma croceum F 1598]